MCDVEILIRQIVSTCVSNLSVNYSNLPVIAVVQEHIQSRQNRVKYTTFDS